MFGGAKNSEQNIHNYCLYRYCLNCEFTAFPSVCAGVRNVDLCMRSNQSNKICFIHILLYVQTDHDDVGVDDDSGRDTQEERMSQNKREREKGVKG